VGLAEEERLPPPLQDQSEVVYRMELQQAERELVIKDLSAIGRASPRGEVLLDFLEQKSQ
jgi:hypothetical protein